MKRMPSHQFARTGPRRPRAVRHGLAGAREQDKRAAQGQVQQAQGAVAEVNAARAEVEGRAPVAGEINKRMADPGELVPAGYPVFTLVDIDRMWVAMNLRESQMQGLKVGSKLQGSVPALGLTANSRSTSSIRPVTMQPGVPPASRPAMTSAASRCGCARYAASRASAPA